MKTSTYEDDAEDEVEDDADAASPRGSIESSATRASPVSTPQYSCSEPPPVPVRTIKRPPVEPAAQSGSPASPEPAPRAEPRVSERWSDSTASLPGQPDDADTDPANAQCEPASASEMYYTASSEVSLISDTEVVDKAHAHDEDEDRDDRKNVIAGHVAAMRERFESMTRTNTPCPDLIRSLSPSLEVFRNVSPSPDRLT